MSDSDTTTLRKLVGERVAKLRDLHGLNQQQLADKIGKSLGTIKTLETGKTSSSFEVLVAIARYFELSVDQLFPSHFPVDKADKEVVKLMNEIQAYALELEKEDVELLRQLAVALYDRRKPK